MVARTPGAIPVPRAEAECMKIKTWLVIKIVKRMLRFNMGVFFHFLCGHCYMNARLALQYKKAGFRAHPAWAHEATCGNLTPLPGLCKVCICLLGADQSIG